MKQVLIKKGKTIVEEVPSPIVSENEILVQVHYSCISAGTEITGLKNASVPLYQRALKQPEKVKKLLQMIKTQGVTKTITRVKSKIDIANTVGYSASGIVLEV